MSSRNYITHTIGNIAPSAPSVGDEFYNPTTNLLTKALVVNGTALQQVVIPTAGGPVTANTVTATGNITTTGAVLATGNVSTTANVVYNYSNAAPAVSQTYNSFAVSLDTTFL
jgi:hypothetical protein